MNKLAYPSTNKTVFTRWTAIFAIVIFQVALIYAQGIFLDNAPKPDFNPAWLPTSRTALIIAIISILILSISLIVGFIRFFLMQQNLLTLVSPANRKLNPGYVWIQLIPFVGPVFSLFVARKIAASIYAELNDKMIGGISLTSNLPTYTPGLCSALFSCIIAFNTGTSRIITLPLALIFWLVYWFVLYRYKKLFVAERNNR